MINLLVTGMLRSGTTLLEKALNAHPDIRVAYQPFPELFIQVKKRFLTAHGRPDAYHALSHYCLETAYSPSDFTAWLGCTQFNRSFILRHLPLSTNQRLTNKIPESGTFSHWYKYLLQKKQAGPALCLGSKEVLMEEYVHHLTSNNIHCVIIIRDPRDIIASLDYGRGSTFTGDHRPTLFNLRNWRKSVCFAVEQEDNRRFNWITFEALVSQPVETLNRLAHGLGLRPFDEAWWQEGLQDEHGHPWKGNSSFGDMQPFNPVTIGGHARILPETTRLYIEAVCRREISAMGYAIAPASIAECCQRITEFKDPFAIQRPEFEPDYSSRRQNVTHELMRLTAPKDEFFLFRKAARTMMSINMG